MSKWSEFYQGRVNSERYEFHFATKYKPFLDVIESMSLPGEIYLDAGCGIGSTSKQLFKRGLGVQHLLVDSCVHQLNNAMDNLRGAFTVPGEYDLVVEQPNFGSSFVHSHGVLEHFTDTQIRFILNNIHRTVTTSQLKSVHYVPGDGYTTPSFGDERLMSALEWDRICKPTQILEFNDSKDLILIFT